MNHLEAEEEAPLHRVNATSVTSHDFEDFAVGFHTFPLTLRKEPRLPWWPTCDSHFDRQITFCFCEKVINILHFVARHHFFHEANLYTTYLALVTSLKRQLLVLPLSAARTVHRSTLSRALDSVLVNAKTFQTYRSSSVYLVRADTDLGTKAKAHTI